jgi:hypothetical protein
MLGTGGIYVGLEEEKSEGVCLLAIRNEGEKFLDQQGVSKQTPATSARKMKTICSEMLASTEESTWHQNPEHHPHCCESVKPHLMYLCSNPSLL